MSYSAKLHNVATFAFLVVWVGGWEGGEGRGMGWEGGVITFVRTVNTTSCENKFHKLKKTCEKACPSTGKGDD